VRLMSKNIADRIPAEGPAAGRIWAPHCLRWEPPALTTAVLACLWQAIRESNREFNGTDGVQTYIRIVPLSLRQALLVRPQRLPRSLGPAD
jgi:hypothetical protein